MSSFELTKESYWGGRPIARQVREVRPRSRCVVTGTILAVETVRHGGSPAYRVVLDDGNRRARSVVPRSPHRWRSCRWGHHCSAEGTAQVARGRFVVWNPLYKLGTGRWHPRSEPQRPTTRAGEACQADDLARVRWKPSAPVPRSIGRGNHQRLHGHRGLRGRANRPTNWCWGAEWTPVFLAYRVATSRPAGVQLSPARTLIDSSHGGQEQHRFWAVELQDRDGSELGRNTASVPERDDSTRERYAVVQCVERGHHLLECQVEAFVVTCPEGR